MATTEIIVTVVIAVLGSTAISTLVTFFVNRNDSRKETDLCLLRSNITSVWLYCKDTKEIDRHVLDNVEMLYTQYHDKLGGNGFITDIMNDIRSYKII